MAKDITLYSPDGSELYYPKTVSELVYNNENGKTVAEEFNTYKSGWKNMLIQTPTNNVNLIANTNKFIRVSTNELVYINSDSDVQEKEFYTTLYIEVKPNTEYTISRTTYVLEYDSDFTLLQNNKLANAWDVVTFTTTENTKYIRVYAIYSSYHIAANVMSEGDTAIGTERIITSIPNSVNTETILDGAVTNKKIAVNDVKTYHLSNQFINIGNNASDYEKNRCENANLFIKNLYIKKLPDDANGNVYLKQVHNNYPNLGYRVMFCYETTNSELKDIPAFTNKEKPFTFVENDYIKIEVDFNVYISQNLNAEVLWHSGRVYRVNTLALKDFVPYNLTDSIIENSKTCERLTEQVNNVIWNKEVLYPTGTTNLAAKLNSVFEVSSPTKGDKGNLVKVSDINTDRVFYCTKFIKVKPNTIYSISNTTYVQEFDSNFNFLGLITINTSWAEGTFTTKENTEYIRAVTIYSYNGSRTQYVNYLNEGSVINKDYAPINEIEGELVGDLFDNSVTENKLSEDLQKKINSSTNTDLSNYTLYSIGDSMSAANKWQTKVVELTNINWNKENNTKGSIALSVGGTNTFNGFDSGLFRTWNLLKSGYITDDGENSIIILQNVNDGKQIFNPSDIVFTPTTVIEGYKESDFNSSLLSGITPKFGTVIKLLRSGCIGKNLSITSLPTKAGNVTLKIGWSGPGIKNYVITLVANETVESIIYKILEYQYDGITDSLAENGTSVDFSRGATNDTYPITVQFIDTDNTGLKVNITDTSNASTSVAKYFIGDSLDSWNDVNSWVGSLSWSSAYMGCIEMLQKTYPKAKIYITCFPKHHAIPNNYLRGDGTYNTYKWITTDSWEIDNNDRIDNLKKLAEYYNIGFINVDKECGISLSNYSTYYPDGNIHPKDKGYYRIGEVVASYLNKDLILTNKQL